MNIIHMHKFINEPSSCGGIWHVGMRMRQNYITTSSTTGGALLSSLWLFILTNSTATHCIQKLPGAGSTIQKGSRNQSWHCCEHLDNSAGRVSLCCGCVLAAVDSLELLLDGSICFRRVNKVRTPMQRDRNSFHQRKSLKIRQYHNGMNADVKVCRWWLGWRWIRSLDPVILLEDGRWFCSSAVCLEWIIRSL